MIAEPRTKPKNAQSMGRPPSSWLTTSTPTGSDPIERMIPSPHTRRRYRAIASGANTAVSTAIQITE
jgi:hypothetical protein